MDTQTDRHVFRNIPLHVSGKIPVARVSGEVLWRREDTTVRHIHNIMLQGEDGGLIELDPTESLWPAIAEALALESLDVRASESASLPSD